MGLSAADYVFGVAELAAVAAALAFGALRVRSWLLPEWTGAPARLVEALLAVAALVWLVELLGAVGQFREVPFVVEAIVVGLLAGALAGRAAGASSVTRRPGPPAPPPHERRDLGGGGGRSVGRRPLERRGALELRERDVRLRHDLVPHAVRGPLRPGRLAHGPSLHLDLVSELVLPRQLGALPQRRDPAHRPRLSLAARQRRVAGPGDARRMVHRTALGPGAGEPRGRLRDLRGRGLRRPARRGEKRHPGDGVPAHGGRDHDQRERPARAPAARHRPCPDSARRPRRRARDRDEALAARAGRRADGRGRVRRHAPRPGGRVVDRRG